MSHQTARRNDVLNLSSGLESLQSSPEFRGPVEPIDDDHHHCCNDHIALIHETREEQFAAVVPFLREGLRNGERCLYVVDDTSRDAVVSALREGGVDVDAALASGQLTFHTVEETYLRNGEFRPDEMLEFYGATIEEANREYEALRLTAETGWLLDESTSLEDWMEYESRVNELFAGEDCVALCQYDRTDVPPELIRDLVQTHPHLIYDGTVCHNFYYTPPEEFLGPAQPDNEVERMLRTLVERTRAKSQLTERERHLHELSETVADTRSSFDAKLRELLELGREQFGLELGYFTRTDEGTFEILEAVGGHDLIETGTTGSIRDTYCEKLLASPGSIAVTNAADVGWDDDPAYERFGLESYFATTVHVGGQKYGTLCFASQTPRETPFSDDERAFLDLMGQLMKYEIERRHREERLTALNALNQSLMTAETVAEVTERTAEAAAELDLSVAGIGLYDSEEGRIRRAAATDPARRLFDALEPFETGGSVGWEAFLSGESRRRSVDEPSDRPRTSVDELVAVPLRDNGVLVTGLSASGDVPDSEVDFVETVAANVTTALDRARREQQLQERERTLEERNEALTRLDRVNTIIRSIDQALVSAASRSEIESVVCDRLTEAGPYEFAWIGEYDSLACGMTPKERAGEGEGTSVDPVEGDVPTLADRAAETRETQVVNDLLTDAGGEEWRQAALNRGYHAAVALPLVYEDTMFGVLTVFADRPGAFDDLEEAVLDELGDNIAHAINAVENKRSLVSNDVTELTFEVPTEAFAFGEMVRETGGTYEHEGIVARNDGTLRWFFSTRGVAPEEVLAFEPRLRVDALEVVDERESDGDALCLFEVRLPYRGLPRQVLEHGGKLHELRIDGDAATVTVDLHTGTCVREFVETFRRNYEGAELVSKCDRERPLQTVGELRSVLTETLTTRQLEAIQTAYYSGYFEEPRTRTGGEIAGSMDISQPTFTTHLRNAERKIYGELFDGAP